MCRFAMAGFAGPVFLALLSQSSVAAAASYTRQLAQATPPDTATGTPAAKPDAATGEPSAAPDTSTGPLIAAPTVASPTVGSQPVPPGDGLAPSGTQPTPPAGTQATAPATAPSPAAPTAPPVVTPAPTPTAPAQPNQAPPGSNPNGVASQPPAKPSLGTVRNTPGGAGTNTGSIDPRFYGSTLSSPDRPQGSFQSPYGGTQRNNGLSTYDNAQPLGGASPYGGTQSTIGTPQFTTLSPNGGVPAATTSTSTRSLTGTTLPGNTANNNRAPLGSVPLTRDQITPYGGRGGYTAQGIYTGTAGQSIGYGQPYALSGRPVGGVISNTANATAPLRPYVPLDMGRASGPTNSGYGIPNGSRATTMDARGIQRTR